MWQHPPPPPPPSRKGLNPLKIYINNSYPDDNTTNPIKPHTGSTDPNLILSKHKKHEPFA